MSEASNISLPLNIYDEDLNEDTTWDLSFQDLKCVPEIKNPHLCILYLQNNNITSLPDDFFPSLLNMMYLDIRDNQLTDLPKSIKHHPCLTHLLLQNNKLTSLPDELGTVLNLKVLQLSGNPLMYPPREVINQGVSSVKQFLYDKYVDSMFNTSTQSDNSERTVSTSEIFPDNYSQGARSYNSVIDGQTMKKLTIKVNEKESESDEEYYSKAKGKCPKLVQCRLNIPHYYQSSKYPRPLRPAGKEEMDEKIKRSYLRDLAIKKHKELLEMRDKILQERKNLEQLKNWRADYRMNKSHVDCSYRMDPEKYPYETHPDYMTTLTREDIEKDLPDKYKKKLVRRAKPTVPRKSNNDVHLALKIKQLFDNLEAIDLNRKDMTPRTEQKMLMNEIQKISEIKQKLMELSSTNTRSVEAD